MLNQRRINVLNEIYSGVHPVKAYLNHYDVKSEAVASSCVYRMLADESCKAYLNKMMEEERLQLIKTAIATKEEAAQIASEIMRARFSDFDIDNPTKEQLNSPALKEVRHTSGHSAKKDSDWSTWTIKLESPLAAAEFLAKLYGWNEEKQGNVFNLSDVKILVAYEQPKQLKE